MHVFVTGATGYIGSAVAQQLLAAGHSVVGLARTSQKAQLLQDQGITPLLGDLEQVERSAVQAMLAVMERTSKAFLYTSDQLIYGDLRVKQHQRKKRRFIRCPLWPGDPG